MLVEWIERLLHKVSYETPEVDDDLITKEQRLVELDRTLFHARRRAGLAQDEREEERDA